MPTTIAPAVNLQAGVVTPAAPPTFSDVGNAVRACVIFNYSSSVLTVTGTFGQKFLGPLTADLFDCPGIQGTPSLSPTTIAAANTYVGIAQAVFYYAGDALPTTYPQPLVAFPGGSQQIAKGLAVPSLVGQSTAFVLPSGANTITSINPTGSGQILQLTGVQSGTTYQATANSAGVTTFSIFPVLDTTYTLQSRTAGATTNDIYASPSPPTPTFPTQYVSASVANTGTLLAAPSTGANYLFSVSLIGAASAMYTNYCLGSITATTIIAQSIFSNTLTTDIDHVDLKGLRVTQAILTSNSVNQNGSQVLLYAPGP